MTKCNCPFCGCTIEVEETFCGNCGTNVKTLQNKVDTEIQDFSQSYHQTTNITEEAVQEEDPLKALEESKLDIPMLLGMSSLIMTAIGFFVMLFDPFMSAIFHFIGLITGIIGLVKAKKDKAMAIIGIILSSIGLLISLVFLILYLILLYAIY